MGVNSNSATSIAENLFINDVAIGGLCCSLNWMIMLGGLTVSYNCSSVFSRGLNTRWQDGLPNICDAALISELFILKQ